MIKAKFEKVDNGKALAFNIGGHSGLDESGKDIICSAASILTYTLAQSVAYIRDRKGLKNKPTIRLEEGSSSIVAKPAKSAMLEALYAYRNAEIGFALLAQTYPDYVSVKLFDAE